MWTHRCPFMKIVPKSSLTTQFWLQSLFAFNYIGLNYTNKSQKYLSCTGGATPLINERSLRQQNNQRPAARNQKSIVIQTDDQYKRRLGHCAGNYHNATSAFSSKWSMFDGGGNWEGNNVSVVTLPVFLHYRIDHSQVKTENVKLCLYTESGPGT